MWCEFSNILVLRLGKTTIPICQNLSWKWTFWFDNDIPLLKNWSYLHCRPNMNLFLRSLHRSCFRWSFWVGSLCYIYKPDEVALSPWLPWVLREWLRYPETIKVIIKSNNIKQKLCIALAYRIDSTPPSYCGWLIIVGIGGALRKAYGRDIITAIHLSVQLERK